MDEFDPYSLYRWTCMSHMDQLHITHTDQVHPYDLYGSTWVNDIFIHSLKMLDVSAIALSAIAW